MVKKSFFMSPEVRYYFEVYTENWCCFQTLFHWVGTHASSWEQGILFEFVGWFRFYHDFWIISRHVKRFSLYCITHFRPMFYFYTSWKHQRKSDFLMFSRIAKVVVHRTTWATFHPKLKKLKKNHFEKISYIFSKRVFLIFQEIEFSCPKLKKFLIFF